MAERNKGKNPEGKRPSVKASGKKTADAAKNASPVLKWADALLPVLKRIGAVLARFFGILWRSPAFKLPFTLVAITGISALALGFINASTAPVIEENSKAQMNDALMLVMDAASPPFEEAGDGLYIARDASGEIAGYCARELASGFDPSPIEMVVGVNRDGSVRKVHIISMSETPGLGTKAADEGFLSQFNGKSGSAEIQVDAISGATVTSNAVAKGVQRALIRAAEIME